jgi:hypothetical protein
MKRIVKSIAIYSMCIFLTIAFSASTIAQNKRPGGAGGGGKKPSAAKSSNVKRPTGGGDVKRGNQVNSGNRNINAGNKNNVGNKVNVDNSKKNVNINVDNSKSFKVNNSHNTSVRRTNNYRPYSRPPYRYGGYRYNCYRPYYYHPYRPFVWGPVWHPWGFFVATIATTAIIISVADADLPPIPNQTERTTFTYAVYTPSSSAQMLAINAAMYEPATLYDNTTRYNTTSFAQDYYYDEGVFYIKSEGGYTVVAAPVGATIKTLPKGYETVKLDDGTTNYYFGGAFYEKSSGGYTVVPPTAGTFVEHLSDGGEEVTIGDVKYVKLGETYYQPSQESGKNGYEVADVEEDK